MHKQASDETLACRSEMKSKDVAPEGVGGLSYDA